MLSLITKLICATSTLGFSKAVLALLDANDNCLCGDQCDADGNCPTTTLSSFPRDPSVKVGLQMAACVLAFLAIVGIVNLYTHYKHYKKWKATAREKLTEAVLLEKKEKPIQPVVSKNKIKTPDTATTYVEEDNTTAESYIEEDTTTATTYVQEDTKQKSAKKMFREKTNSFSLETDISEKKKDISEKDRLEKDISGINISEKDGPSKSPKTSRRQSKSPEINGPSKSPEIDGQSKSPEIDGQSKSPEIDGPSKSPKTSRRPSPKSPTTGRRPSSKSPKTVRRPSSKSPSTSRKSSPADPDTDSESKPKGRKSPKHPK